MATRAIKQRMARYMGRDVAALLFALFATASPVQAAVESVAPISGGTVWRPSWKEAGWFPSAAAVCSSVSPSDGIVNGTLTYVGIQPNPAYPSYMDCIFFFKPGDGTPGWNTLSGTAIPYSNAVCPVPTVNPTVSYQYKVSSGMCEREVTCLAPNAINPATGQCEPPVDCPVTALTEPPFNDACATVLENIHSTQAQKDAACGTLTQALKDGKACLEDKLSRTPNAANPIPLKVTSDIRSVAYQAHLRQIWDKMELLVPLMEEDPTMQTACAARRAEIAAEKGCNNADVCTSCYAASATQRSHCLKGMPANPNPNDAQHTQGNAFDVSGNVTIAPLQAALDARKPPQTIQQFLDDPNPKDCKLIWGGTFKTNKDPVHFYAR